MRLSASEKQEIIRLVDGSELGVNKTLQELGIHKSTFYKWYRAYLERGSDGIHPIRKTRQQLNSIPSEQKQLVVEIALEHPTLSPRELAVKTNRRAADLYLRIKCLPNSEGQRINYNAGSYSA